MTSRSAVGIHFTATPVAAGAAVHVEIHEPNLDFDASDALKTRLHDAIGGYLVEGYRSFVLDLTGVERIDSCGVGLLIGMHHKAVGAGGTLVVVVVSPFVRKVLRMMRLDRFLELETSLDRALRNVPDAV